MKPPSTFCLQNRSCTHTPLWRHNPLQSRTCAPSSLWRNNPLHAGVHDFQLLHQAVFFQQLLSSSSSPAVPLRGLLYSDVCSNLRSAPFPEVTTRSCSTRTSHPTQLPSSKFNYKVCSTSRSTPHRRPWLSAAPPRRSYPAVPLWGLLHADVCPTPEVGTAPCSLFVSPLTATQPPPVMSQSLP